MRSPRLLPRVLAAVLALDHVGCGPGPGDSCDVLTYNTETAATVFTPVIPGMVVEATIQQRIDLVDQIEDPPHDGNRWPRARTRRRVPYPGAHRRAVIPRGCTPGPAGHRNAHLLEDP